jgi:hypothetical protein
MSIRAAFVRGSKSAKMVNVQIRLIHAVSVRPDKSAKKASVNLVRMIRVPNVILRLKTALMMRVCPSIHRRIRVHSAERIRFASIKSARIRIREIYVIHPVPTARSALRGNVPLAWGISASLNKRILMSVKTTKHVPKGSAVTMVNA